MNQYLLSVYEVEGSVEGSPPTPEDMQAFMAKVLALEEQMDTAGAFVFGGALHSPDTATVVRDGLNKVLTDGPFVEAKEHIAGFYVINAESLDEALQWAARPATPPCTPSRCDRSVPLADSTPRPDRSNSEDPMSDVATAFRQANGRAVATLARTFGDISLAEDAVQDAFVRALATWPRDGIPANPAGWIITTARNRALDVVRRDTRGRELTRKLATDQMRGGATPTDDEDSAPMRDDQTRLIFTCCHPALRVEHQVALTLRLIAGLTPAEVARAFLTGEDTMAKRLVRAKHKIKAATSPTAYPRTPSCRNGCGRSCPSST